MAKFKVEYVGSSPGQRDVTIKVIEGVEENKLTEAGKSLHAATFPAEKLVWRQENNWTLFLELEPSAVNYFKAVDAEFSISEVKGGDSAAKSK
jgi:hypothetical protein